MARKAGRPPLPPGKRRATRLVRLADDIGAKLVEVVAAEGTSTDRVLDPLVRAEIERRHKANLPAIKVLRAARKRAAATTDATGGEN